MKPALPLALALLALPAGAQTLTVTFDPDRALQIGGQDLVAPVQQTQQAWEAKVEAREKALRDRKTTYHEHSIALDAAQKAAVMREMETLEEDLKRVMADAESAMQREHDAVRSAFSERADSALQTYSQANGVGEILLDPDDGDGPAFIVLTPAYDISVPIGEMAKSGPGAEAAAGPNRPAVIRYVDAELAYYSSGRQGIDSQAIREQFSGLEDRLFARQATLGQQAQNLEQRRLLLTPEQFAEAYELLSAEEADIFADAAQLETDRMNSFRLRLINFKEEIGARLASDPAAPQADIVRFTDDQALRGIVKVAHPGLNITDEVAALFRAQQ